METQPRKISARKAIIASALLLSIGAGGIAASGAWFTSQQSLASNQVKTATIALSSPGSTFNLANIVPIADGDVATKSTPFSMTVDNTNSTVAVDWVTALIFPANMTDAQKATAGRMRVQYSVDGTNWLPSDKSLTLAALGSAPATITGSALGAGQKQAVSFRAWLPGAASSNDDQGQTITFDLRARVIQAGAGSGARDADSNYN